MQKLITIKSQKLNTMKNTLLTLLVLISIVSKAQIEQKVYTFQLVHAYKTDSLGKNPVIYAGDSIVYILNLTNNYFEIRVIKGYRDEKKLNLINGKTVVSTKSKLIYSNSFGNIKNIRYSSDKMFYILNFIWEYKNSYDSNTGDLKVTLILSRSKQNNIGTFISKNIKGEYCDNIAVCKEIE